MTKIVGIVNNDTWNIGMWNNQGAMGVYAAEFWDIATTNVTLVRYHPDNPSNSLAHEIGHMYGLELSEQYKDHPPNGLPVSGLVLRDGQIFDIPSDYQNPKRTGSGRIAPLDYSWNKSFLGAAGIFDLMGNAGYYLHDNGKEIVVESHQQSWVIYETYNSLLEALKDPSNEDIFFVQGVIGLDGLVNLNPMVQMDGIPDEPTTEGDYELQLLDSGGSVLYSTRFGYSTKPGLFNLQLPYTPGIGRLVVLQGGSVVGQLNRSPYPPEITMLPLPLIGSEETTMNVSWTGSDPDGDVVSYSLQYNCDGTEIWVPLAANLSQQSYNVNLNHIPGGTCTFKVTASDGVNSSSAISDPFGAPPKGPLVQLITESDTYAVGETILLSAKAYDLEDGVIPNGNMHWTSDLDGNLGSGSTLSVLLSEGTHNLTLYAMDAAGNGSVAQVTLEIKPSSNIDDGDGDVAVDGESVEDDDNSRTFLVIGLVVLAVILMGGAGLLLWFALRKSKGPAPIQAQPSGGGQPGSRQQNMTQDNQGRWWYQDPTTGARSYWNGTKWVKSSNVPPPGPPVLHQAPFQAPKAAKSRVGSSCLFTLVIAAVLGVVVIGGISLVAFDILPFGEIQPGEGNLTNILKMGGGGLLVTVLGGFLINGGLKSIITRRAVVEDDWGRQREKRGCSAILNGIGSLFFGIICLIGGLGLMTLAIFQEVLPWIGF